MTRYVVVGGGIIGLATAFALCGADPGATVTVLEKEADLAQHQTGRNSGVIHSGIYYPPGSAKATMCRAGATSMISFAETHGVPVQVTGKLIVATSADDLPGLDKLYYRGLANRVPVTRISPEQARQYEPFVTCVGALRVASTGVTDYAAVCRALATEIRAAGADVRLSTAVTGFDHRQDGTVVESTAGPFHADVVINCAGLQADLLADADPATDPADVGNAWRIIPFRGEYYELRPERTYLVKSLIYPVPDPAFPFLGVHLTRMLDGSVLVGPNAVLALAREGYDWRTIRPADIGDLVRFAGFWRMARRNLRPGLMEVSRSLSRKRFAAGLARLVPGITADDLIPSKAGVRAQALSRDGDLVDDFLILRRGRNVHVLNAPSPAATSSLEIGKHIASLARPQP